MFSRIAQYLYSHGPHSHAPCSHGLYSHGLYSYGIYSYGLYGYGAVHDPQLEPGAARDGAVAPGRHHVLVARVQRRRARLAPGHNYIGSPGTLAITIQARLAPWP